MERIKVIKGCYINDNPYMSGKRTDFGISRENRSMCMFNSIVRKI